VLIKPFKRKVIEKMLLKWTHGRGEEPAADFFGIEDTSDNAACVFDTVEMMDAFLNNEELVLGLLARFIERTRVQIDTIPDLEKAGDWDDARRNVHTIKGVALTLGGKELGKAAARAELAYKNMNRTEMEAAYPFLQEAFNRFRKEAENFINSRT
jgi:HPt (histidine-containing phosphotransfer) domain-containing protein